MREAMKLRLTMYTLGMEHYTGHLDMCYADSVEERLRMLWRSTWFLTPLTRPRTPSLVALAPRIHYLITHSKIDQAQETAYLNLFGANKKYQRLTDAVNHDEVQAMAARERELQ